MRYHSPPNAQLFSISPSLYIVYCITVYCFDMVSVNFLFNLSCLCCCAFAIQHVLLLNIVGLIVSLLLVFKTYCLMPACLLVLVTGFSSIVVKNCYAGRFSENSTVPRQV